MLNRNILFVFLLIDLASCRDKIDFVIEDSDVKQLVVEGNINDKEGPYYVYLSYASPKVVNDNPLLEVSLRMNIFFKLSLEVRPINLQLKRSMLHRQ